MLEINFIVPFDHRPHRVVMVNESRAIIVPIKRVVASVANPNNPWPDGVSISPNSELPILGIYRESAPSTLNPQPSTVGVTQPDLFP